MYPLINTQGLGEINSILTAHHRKDPTHWTPEPTDEQIDKAIQAADARWADADVPKGWARHFANSLLEGHPGRELSSAALKLALDLAIMHHSDDGYAELRSKVRQLAKEALVQPNKARPLESEYAAK